MDTQQQVKENEALVQAVAWQIAKDFGLDCQADALLMARETVYGSGYDELIEDECLTCELPQGMCECE